MTMPMDKMKTCKFCATPSAELLSEEIGTDENGNPVRIHVDCDGQNLRYYDDFCSSIVTRRIYFCPMCGRRCENG